MRTAQVITRILIIASLSFFAWKAFAQTPDEDMLRKGVGLIRNEKYDEAIKEFSKLVAADPNSSNAYYNIGFAYDAKGDLAKAIANFSKAIELDPAFTDAYYNRAFAYYKKGDLKNSLADYGKVIALSPDSADAHYGMGLVYAKKGDSKNAIAEYTEAIKIRPNFALAYSARAVEYVSRKNYLAALGDVNKAQSIGYRARRLKRMSAAPAGAAQNNVSLPGTRSAQGPDIKTTALLTSGSVFFLVACMHLLRMILRVRVTAGKFTVPVWFSIFGFIIPLILSLWMFRAGLF